MFSKLVRFFDNLFKCGTNNLTSSCCNKTTKNLQFLIRCHSCDKMFEIRATLHKPTNEIIPSSLIDNFCPTCNLD